MAICVYCRRDRTLTREHVWPTWIAQLPAKDPEYTNVIESVMDSEKARRWSSSGTLGQTVRIVCGECNGGWMGDLEGEAQRLIGPMIMGRRVTLTREDQRAVATWIAKTHQMYRLGIVRRPPPAADLAHVYKHREPPEGTLVTLAAWRGSAPAAFLDLRAHLQRATRINVPNDPMREDSFDMELLTARIGYFVFQTQRAYVRAGQGPLVRLRPRDPERASHFVLDIWPWGDDLVVWPEGRRSVVWPPRGILDERGFEFYDRRGSTG